MTSPSAAEVRGSVPVVRGLEWAFNSTNSVWSGELPFNTYYTINGEGPKWRVFRGQFLSSADEEEIAYVADQSEAKAAAQADWEKLSREILNPAFLSALEASQAEVERWREYASTLSAVVHAIAPMAGSEAFKQVAPDTFRADPAYFAHRIAELRQAAHDGKLAKVEASRAQSALTAAQERIAELEGALEPFALISSEGVVTKGYEGFATITTSADYFHRAAATLSPAVKENDRGEHVP